MIEELQNQVCLVCSFVSFKKTTRGLVYGNSYCRWDLWESSLLGVAYREVIRKRLWVARARVLTSDDIRNEAVYPSPE